MNDRRRMKISLIAPTYLPSRRANTIQVMKMAQALTGQGHAVHVLVPNPEGRPEADRDELAAHYGLNQAFEISWVRCAPGLRSYDYALKAVRIAQKEKAELVYTRLPQAATLASQRQIPTIYEVHDMPRGFMGRRLFRTILGGGGTKRLVVITRALLADLQAEYGAQKVDDLAVVAPDGVDLARFQGLPAPDAARSDLPPVVRMPDGFTAGYTGHLYAGRGVDLILDLAAELPDVNFLLVGGNPDDVKRYRGAAEARKLARVFFTGFVPNAELPAYQAACDVLLMPYQEEVAASSGGNIGDYLSPMKVFEYMASGRAILSSDLPVLQEILSSENAVLLPPEDVQAWKSALLELSDEPEKRNALTGQALTDVREYTWERRVEKILTGILI